LNPFDESQSIRRKSDKKMHMVGHDYISANCDPVFLRMKAKGTESLVHFQARQQRQSSVRIKRDKVKRPAICKKPVKTRRTTRVTLFLFVKHLEDFAKREIRCSI